jgi:hypothetical protein
MGSGTHIQSSLNDRQWRWLARFSEYRYDREYRAIKHKFMLNLNTKKREAHEMEIPKVFDYTSGPDYGELLQTIDLLGDKQLKPSESRYDIREGNLIKVWTANSTLGFVSPRNTILHHDTPLGTHFPRQEAQTRLMQL